VSCLLAVLALTLVTVARPASAQYFGQNKVQYRTFDFQILKTDHFDIYYYPEESEAAGLVSRLAERWYSRLSRFFSHELRGRQVVVLYASTPQFRQTNVIEGLIGEGTGGVTEALRRRVVLPMAGSLADTNHVLGHELVHAFQYDISGTDARDVTGGSPGIAAYPLWFVEGMAEYVSLGPVDAQTAMWLRDAALREKLPSIKDLDDPKYFPYRWGQAFWAYIGGKYGDHMVASLVRSAANPRFDLVGLAHQLGTDPDTLTADWHNAIRKSTEAALVNRASIESEPRLVISKSSGSGRFNVGPRLSPDGKQVVYFSERDRFAVELYLADAESGKILRKLVHTATDPHFDSLEFLDSAGAWSPDGRTIAITAVRSGRPIVTLVDAASGDVVRELNLPGLDDAIDPVYSPDGRSIAISGNRGGLSDLYLVTLDTGKVDQLTKDPFADLEPVFTPDGKSLVFVTERFSTDLTTLQGGPLRLARLDLSTRAVSPIPGFLRGKHLSPQVSADGQTLTFIAEPDGISNLYRMPIDGGPIVQLTAVPTGIAGITSSSPALSAAPSGRLAFSLFEDDGHSVYVLEPDKIVSLVSPALTDAGAALPGRAANPGDIERLLRDPARGLPAPDEKPPSQPDNHKLALDVIAQPSVSVGVSSVGTFVGGGIGASFSDMLGDRQLSVGAVVGGKLLDLQAQLTYQNRRHRWNWGAAIAQVSNGVGFIDSRLDPGGQTVTATETIVRQTGPAVGGLTSYPLSKSTRIEFVGDLRSVSFSTETIVVVYPTAGFGTLSRTDNTVSEGRALRLATAGTALVHDTTYYGATSPIYGSRYRIQLDQTAGTIAFSTATIDWRHYWMPKRPVTIAVRALHVGRYGSGADDPELVPFYIGYPQLVHGYGFGSVTVAECQTPLFGTCHVLDSLIGSRALIGNVEVRAPLWGLLRGDLQYGRVPIEVAGFYDAGVTWSNGTLPAFLGGTRDWVRSAGGAMRVNLFGIAILEFAVSHPFDRPDRRVQWQFALKEGF
jgi:Tol biopolymer transport system component